MMKVLFIGGTGVISTAVSRLAVEKGIDLYLLNRGNNNDRIPEGAKTIVGDIRSESINDILKDYTFDIVVDFIGFVPAHIKKDIELFKGRVKQYIYISSASAYQKPAKNYIVTEETPLENPYWEYSRLKQQCEEILFEEYRNGGFPVTVVRPSLTYGNTNIGLVLGSWACPYTTINRMKQGKKVIVPGDGLSLWTMTHNSDFAKGLVGLLGNEKAIGEAFHITSDEVLSWNKIFMTLYDLLGVKPNIIHIPSDFVSAVLKDKAGTLLGDKSESIVFDNSKIKSYVPEFEATTSFREGAKQYLEYVSAKEERMAVDEDWDKEIDRVISLYERAYEGL